MGTGKDKMCGYITYPFSQEKIKTDNTANLEHHFKCAIHMIKEAQQEKINKKSTGRPKQEENVSFS